MKVAIYTVHILKKYVISKYDSYSGARHGISCHIPGF